MKISIGICAHNEEKNIGKLLNNLLHHFSDSDPLTEILIVASGCTDKTETVIKEFTKKNQRIKLLSQKERRGKASAVNLLLKKANGDLIVFVSADNLPTEGSIKKLLKPFSDRRVGATTSRPIPVNKTEKFTGFMTHLIWRLHHQISLIQPKLTGEFCAIREGIVDKIPVESMVDDAALEEQIHGQGCKIVYVPEATSYMRGPDSIRELIVQRRRIARGYLQMKGERFNISTYHTSYVLREIIEEIKKNPNKIPHLFVAVFIEFLSRLLASLDALFGRETYIWETIPSTKNVQLK